MALQTQINAQINKARENTRAEILIEDMIKRNSHFTLTGRTSDNTVVLVTSPSTISPGSIREVYITDSSPHGLKGIVTENHP